MAEGASVLWGAGSLCPTTGRLVRCGVQRPRTWAERWLSTAEAREQGRGEERAAWEVPAQAGGSSVGWDPLRILRGLVLARQPPSLPYTQRFPLFIGWRNRTAQTMLGRRPGEASIGAGHGLVLGRTWPPCRWGSGEAARNRAVCRDAPGSKAPPRFSLWCLCNS